MTEQNFALFDTAIGRCGIAWNDRGLIGVQLTHADEAATRRRMRQRYPNGQEAPPPADVWQAVDGVTGLLRGEPRDLTAIVIDDSETPVFNAQVYTVTRTVPPGRTITYGEIAERLGDKMLAREVGQALGQNPCPIVSRVIACSQQEVRPVASPPAAASSPN